MMDESKPEKLEKLVSDTERYLTTHEGEMRAAAESLMEGKLPSQRMREWVERGWRDVCRSLGTIVTR